MNPKIGVTNPKLLEPLFRVSEPPSPFRVHLFPEVQSSSEVSVLMVDMGAGLKQQTHNFNMSNR